MKTLFFASAQSYHTARWFQALKNKIEIELLTFDESSDLSPDCYTTIKSQAPGKAKYLFAVENFKAEMIKSNPVILHAHYATGYGYLGAKMKFHPYVVSVWGSDVFDWPTKSLLHKKMLQWILGKADAICATSQKLYDGVNELFPDYAQKLNIIPFGIDTKLFSPLQQKPESETIVIGTAKLFAKIYQLDLLLKTFDNLAQDYDNIILKIVGEGPERDNLIALKDSLSSRNRIEILEPIPNSQLPEFLRALDIFAMPSKFESYGVAALEAGACGVPVLAFEVGGIPEIITDGSNGRLVAEGDNLAYENALRELVEDKHKRIKLGQNARKQAYEKADLDNCANKLVDLYKQLL